MSDTYTPSTATVPADHAIDGGKRIEYFREVNCVAFILTQVITPVQGDQVHDAAHFGIVIDGDEFSRAELDTQEKIADVIRGGAEEFWVTIRQGKHLRHDRLFFVLGNGADCVLADGQIGDVMTAAEAAQEAWADDAACKAPSEV